MRKRFISGLTALCIVGILITNMITSASASVTAALVGASVAGSLLLGTLFNQMCGGQGYDFTDAFQGAVNLYTEWDENFDGSAKDPIHPVTKVEIDTSKVNIPDNIDFNSVGGTSADKMILEMQKAINAGLEDGSIEISFDENGNISMPTTSWCNAVNDVYESFGCYKSKDGSKRAQTLYSIISPYVYSNYNGWSISSNAVAQWEADTFGKPTSGRFLHFVPYFVADSKLHIMRYSARSRTVSVGFSTAQYNLENTADMNFSGWNDYFDTIEDMFFSCSTNITLKSHEIQYSVGCGIFSSDTVTQAIPSEYQVAYSGKSTDDFDVVQGYGFCAVSDKDYSAFCSAAKQGTLEQNKESVSIPLTGVENTIGNMGLAGVGSGATKGTVSVDSKTKDITVTNEATKEAELVIEQSKPGDIDIPDSDSIIDKFPFSLPFDIYNLVTIFVRDEQKPIFEIPIQTTLDIAGEDYKVDEKIVLDLTQFQLNGVDIIRVFTRTVTYIAFIAFLIKITPHVIKH